jgi:5,5'-dehydrodivanillate O-demethylase
VSIVVERSAPGIRVDFASSAPETPGGKLLRKFWQPVYVGRDLAPGSMVPIQVMNEWFTLYRGESGTAHVVGYRCPHRNTQLSPGWVRGDAVQCLYHGWTFDASGACIARPGEQPPGPCAHVSLPAYPTHEHRGLIYAFLGTGEAPPFPGLPMFGNDTIVENLAVEFPCNWFQTYENQVDEVHLAFVHTRSESHTFLDRERSLPETHVTETAYGFDRETWSNEKPKRLCVYPFPNHMRMAMTLMAIGLQGPFEGFLTLVPIDDERHMLYITIETDVPLNDAAAVAAHDAVQAEYRARIATLPSVTEVGLQILDGKLTMDQAMSHPFRTLIEDVVAQRGQGAIHDRTKEVLGRSDVGIARLRKIFERELLAIQNGEAGKTWDYSGMPAATMGA